MIRFVLLKMSCMALPASETWNLIPAEASMIQLMTGQTVYGQKPAMRHIRNLPDAVRGSGRSVPHKAGRENTR